MDLTLKQGPLFTPLGLAWPNPAVLDSLVMTMARRLVGNGAIQAYFMDCGS